MKKIVYFIMMLLLAAVVSCDKYNSGISDAGVYKNVYMPRAANDSTVLAVTTDAAEYHLGYSAYLGGTENATGDITVSFNVSEADAMAFNNRYGTNYPLLPPGNYALSNTSAVIRSGQRSTDSLTLTIKSDNALSLFKTYILPVGIKAVDGGQSNLAKTYTTTYYLVRVGQEEILNTGANWGGIFCLGPKNTVITNDKVSKDILMYLPDDKGFYKRPPLRIGINWDASESFYYVNENAMVVRNAPYWAGLFRFDMHPENIVQTNPKPAENIITSIADWNTFWLGDFWNKYLIATFGSYILTVDNAGILWRQPVFSKIDQNRTQVATGFNFSQVVAYPAVNSNALLCLTAGGDLWYYPASATAVPGTGKKVGSGWNVFKKIMVSGNDILALSASNGVYRLAFDPGKNYIF
ncbi:DUF1735 domain-containing protein [Niabella sp.]|uniref:DUF1735 domain-containing protein n=1 Tax=Niabella sp. TaxID=1962976 RepID=UPI002628E414|nr:DUF1735 domain-containing protein [Niabella sp.]